LIGAWAAFEQHRRITRWLPVPALILRSEPATRYTRSGPETRALVRYRYRSAAGERESDNLVPGPLGGAGDAGRGRGALAGRTPDHCLASPRRSRAGVPAPGPFLLAVLRLSARLPDPRTGRRPRHRRRGGRRLERACRGATPPDEPGLVAGRGVPAAAQAPP